jgi:hypothetical protein
MGWRKVGRHEGPADIYWTLSAECARGRHNEDTSELCEISSIKKRPSMICKNHRMLPSVCFSVSPTNASPYGDKIVISGGG